VLAAGVGEDVFVGLGVLVPELTLFEVGGGELPVLVRVVDAGLEAAGLLVVGDVEEELEDDDVVVGDGLLPLVDVLHALVGGFGADEAVDAGGEDVFVVGAVEDFDHAAGWGLDLAAPEEVVAGFDGGWDLEAGDVAALGVDAGEDVVDGAVFAGGVHALEDDEEGFGLRGVEDVLEVRELVAMFGEDGLGGAFVGDAVVVGGGEVGEFYLAVGLDEVGGFELHGRRSLSGFGKEKTTA